MDQAAPKAIHFGRYQLIERIAQGGMGEIYLAQFSGVANFKKRCIIKKILPELASSPAFVEKFLQEGRTLVSLTHSNIVQVFDMGSVNGEYFIAMEHIAGADLRFLLRNSKLETQALPIGVCAHVIMEVLNGLGYAHSAVDDNGQSLNIIHRDISPSNLLISEAGEVKIIDFGIAKTEHQMVESVSGIVQGKFAYMSPEQARGEMLDQRTDLFSCGVVFYEMLTGLRPFEGKSDLQSLERIKTEDFQPASELRKDVDAKLDAILAKAMAKDRDERYPNTEAFYDALERYLNQKQISVNARDLTAAFKHALSTEMRQVVRSNKELVDAAFESMLLAQSNEDADYFTKSLLLTDSFSKEIPKAGPEDFAPNNTHGLALNANIGKGQDPNKTHEKSDTPTHYKSLSITANDTVAVAFWKRKARLSYILLISITLLLLASGVFFYYFFYEPLSPKTTLQANTAQASVSELSKHTTLSTKDDSPYQSLNLSNFLQIRQRLITSIVEARLEAKRRVKAENLNEANERVASGNALKNKATKQNNKPPKREHTKAKATKSEVEKTVILTVKSNRDAVFSSDEQQFDLPAKIAMTKGQTWRITPKVTARQVAISQTGKFQDEQSLSIPFCELIVRISESFFPNDPSPYQIADIYIDGTLYAKKSDMTSFILPCGRHDIQAKYMDEKVELNADKTVQIDEGDITSIALKLKPSL